MKKKTGLIIILLALIYGFSFAQSKSDAVFWVMPTEWKNISKADEGWLPDEVHNALRANITNYSGLTVAEENSEMLAQIQERSYNENISENDAIVMGQQIGANHAIRSTITGTGNGYSLNVIVQELKTGKHLAESNKTAKTTEELYAQPGCAVNEITIELCDRLDKNFGTGLSAMNKRILRSGEADLTADEELVYYQEEQKRQQELIASLNKKLSSLSVSTSADAAAETAKIQAQKAQAEAKQKQAADRAKRLAEEAERRLEDLKAQDTRQDKQKNRISAVEKEIQNKVDSVRKGNFKTSSILAQITSIEAKKKALLEIRESGNSEEQRIRNEYQEEYEKKYDEIMNAYLPPTQTDENGNMLPKVREAREKNAAKEKERLDSEKLEAIRKSRLIASDAEKQLLAQIKEQNQALKEKRVADNIRKDLVLDVSRYNGRTYSWNAVVYLVSDGQILYSTDIALSYEKLTGIKDPDVLSQDYADDVDLYTSLFAKSIPVTAKLSYYVEACPDDQPSKYHFHIDTLQLVHTDTDKEFDKKLINYDFYRTVEPAKDIRAESIIVAEQIAVQKEEQKVREAEQKAAEKVAKKESAKIENKDYIENFGMISGLGAGITVTSDFNPVLFDAWFNFPLMYIYGFVGVKWGMIESFPNKSPFAATGAYLNYWDVGIGINKCLAMSLHPNIFLYIGVGQYMVKFQEGYGFLYKDTEKNKTSFEDIAGYTFVDGTLGVEIPLGKPWISLVISGSVYYADKFGVGGKANVGINLSAFKWIFLL